MKKYKVDLNKSRQPYLNLKPSQGMEDFVKKAIAGGRKKNRYSLKHFSMAAACLALVFLCIYFVPPLHDFAQTALHKASFGEKGQYIKFQNEPGLFSLFNPLRSDMPIPYIENGYFEDINRSVENNGIKFIIDRVIFTTQSPREAGIYSNNFFLIEYTAENLDSSKKVPVMPVSISVKDKKGTFLNSQNYSINKMTGIIPEQDFNSSRYHGIIALGCPDSNTLLPQDLIISTDSFEGAFTNDNADKKTGEWKIDFSWGKKVKEADAKDISVAFKGNNDNIPYSIIKSQSTPTFTVVTIQKTGDTNIFPNGSAIPVLEGFAGDHLVGSNGKLYVFVSSVMIDDSTYKLYYQTSYFENTESLFFDKK